MRGRNKIIVLAVSLSVLLVVSVVFASGLVDFSKIRLLGAPGGVEPNAGSDDVFVNPAYYYKDYTLQPIGSKFTVYVNVTGVTDLYAWQLNMTWNSTLLSLNRIISNEFLARSPNQTSSELLGTVINSTDNVKGTSGLSETILGNISGITGSGRLVSFEFLVKAYGKCDLVISSTGNLATTFLNSAGATITISSETDGYFSNKLTGDINGDKKVDKFDFGSFAQAYGSSGPPAGPSTSTWNREADLNHEGHVDKFDFGIFAQNYGRSTP
jgi:hypothetical protein